MKKETKKQSKLLPTFVGKPKTNKKVNKMDSNINIPKFEKPKNKSSKRTLFTDIEDQFIVQACLTFDGQVINIPILKEIARQCNIHFHKKLKKRTGEALWWHIKREQNKGSELFSKITISGGAPKYKSNQNSSRTTRTQTDTKFAKPPSRPIKQNQQPPKPIESAFKATKQPNKSDKTIEIDVLIRDPETGSSERLKVTKFSSIGELMFAIT